MNINEAYGQIVKSSSNKFLLLGTDAFDIWNFINSTKNFLDAEVVYYDSSDQLFEGVSSSFEDSTKIHVLSETLSVDAKLVAHCGDYLMDTDILIAVAPKKVPKNKDFSNLVAKFTYAEPSKLKEYELVDEISMWLESEGFKITKKSVELLVSYSGKDRFAIHNEVKKLKHLCPDKRISDDAVKSVCCKVGKSDYFGFIESFMKKDYSSVLDYLKASSPGDSFGSIRGVQTELMKVQRVASLVLQGKTASAIADKTGYNSYIIKTKYMSYAKKLGKSRISKMMSILSDAESTIKKSPVDNSLIVEYYFLKALSV